MLEVNFFQKLNKCWKPVHGITCVFADRFHVFNMYLRGLGSSVPLSHLRGSNEVYGMRDQRYVGARGSQTYLGAQGSDF